MDLDIDLTADLNTHDDDRLGDAYRLFAIPRRFGPVSCCWPATSTFTPSCESLR